MKRTTLFQACLHYLRITLRTLYALRPDPPTLFYFLTSGLLCGASFGLGATPLGICLLAACEMKYISACTLGAIFGYGLFWGFSSAFELYSVLSIVLCSKFLLPKATRERTAKIVCTAAVAVMGLLFVILDRYAFPALLRWIVNIVTAFFGVQIFYSAIRVHNERAQIVFGALLLLGASGIHLPGNTSPALAALAWVAAAPLGVYYVCAGSVMLALFQPAAVPYAVIFSLSALLYRVLERKPPLLPCLTACMIYGFAAYQLQSIAFLLCTGLGSVLVFFVAPDPYLPTPKRTDLPEHPVQHELTEAANALSLAGQMLNVAELDRKMEIATIFDSASAQVCRSCAKNSACWQTNMQEVYDDLNACAATVLSRGSANKEDLPQRFQSRCVHSEAFLTALNDALDELRRRRRLRRRIEEARQTIGVQYELIAMYLRKLSQGIYAASPTVNFHPEVSVEAAGQHGNSISGDRGAAFSGPEGTYYVILCDGMGTGNAAAQESTQAIHLLRKLLQSGMEAGAALKTLNNIYLLRDNGCFSTVDLLRINLTSGDAILYKWGAAPSYLKRSNGLRYLGGASLPPGLSKDEKMEQIRLSLDHNCVLVLLSDGLGGKETKQRLESCESMHPQDVAKSLFVGRPSPNDDCTAVAIRLRHVAAREAALL